MTNKLKLSTLAIVGIFAAVLTFDSVALAFTGSGAGTEGNPYQITTCEELQEMNDELDAHYILMNDIDCSGTLNLNDGDGFEPVGGGATPFTGTLDGRGFVISDLFIDRGNKNFVGLFARIGVAGSVQNVGLEGVNITGGEFLGSLTGRNDGEIYRSYATGTVTGDDYEVGGLVGTNRDSGSIDQSYADVDVIGRVPVGGLVGYHEAGVISDSYALGNVEATEELAGGLVGAVHTDAVIQNSYATGTVTGDDSGGLIGDCCAVATVNASFWDTDTSGQATSNGGEGKTTAEMKDILTFSDATWDIETTSTDINDGYPFLSWQAGDSSPVWYIFEESGGEDPNADNDKNGDGIPDNEQPYVSSLTSSLTGKTVVLEVDDGCEIDTVNVAAESTNSVQDSGYNYPVGLMSFTVDCGTPGYTTDVTQYYYGTTDEDYVVRKHNPNTNAYFNVPDADVGQTTVYGQQVLTVTYQVTDGGDLDIDDEANGVIVDPVGLALSAVGAPNTGLGGRLHN